LKGRKNLAIMVVVTLLLVVHTTGCDILENTAKMQEYEMGDDKIPSINAVVGDERQATDVESGFTSEGVQYKQYSYMSGTVTDDLQSYTQHLKDIGWVVTKDYNLTHITGEVELAKESVEDDTVLVMAIVYETGKYEVRINKFRGTVTYY